MKSPSLYFGPEQATIQAFIDEQTSTISYLVSDPATQKAVIIDPVLDYDAITGKVTTQSADRMLDAVHSQGLSIVWILETHAHADHLTAAAYLRKITRAPVGIGEHIREVQKIFRPVFNQRDISGTGAEFDRLFADGDTIPLGNLQLEVINTPGHTPDCVAYRVGDAIFIGDTLFMPDYGTARADFPGGNAHTLYQSIRRLLSLPGHLRLYMCHDYQSEQRSSWAWESTVAEQLEHNIHVNRHIHEDEFVSLRETRDANLDPPLLLLPSLQVNIRAGALPPAEPNGMRYLKTPLIIDQHSALID